MLEIAWNRDMVGKATGRAGAVTMKLGEARWQQAGLAAALAMDLSVPMPAAAGPFTRSEIDSLTSAGEAQTRTRSRCVCFQRRKSFCGCGHNGMKERV